MKTRKGTDIDWSKPIMLSDGTPLLYKVGVDDDDDRYEFISHRHDPYHEISTTDGKRFVAICISSQADWFGWYKESYPDIVNESESVPSRIYHKDEYKHLNDFGIF